MPPISFAVQRPRQNLGDSDSDDEANRKQPAVEFLSDFDAKSSNKRKKGDNAVASGSSLVIQSQPNKDWKKEAQLLRAGSARRKHKTYLPDEATNHGAKGPALTEEQLAAADRIIANTVGGLSGKADSSRSGTATPTTELRGALAHTTLVSNAPSPSAAVSIPEEAESEDAKALRELLKGGNDQQGEGQDQIDVILQHASDSFKLGAKEPNEEDNFRKDLDSRPDSVRWPSSISSIYVLNDAGRVQSTLDDYARVPVEHFGAALLRGMGWGTSASEREARKPTEAIIPKARPALLGIGAKPLTLTEEAGAAASGSRSAPKKSRREEMRFVPLMRREVTSSATTVSSVPCNM